VPQCPTAGDANDRNYLKQQIVNLTDFGVQPTDCRRPPEKHLDGQTEEQLD